VIPMRERLTSVFLAGISSRISLTELGGSSMNPFELLVYAVLATLLLETLRLIYKHR